MTPTSTAQDPPSVQAVSLSFVNGHGVLVVQNWTALTWPAVAGASVGISWIVPAEGLGLALGELEAWGEGVVWTRPTGLLPRPARTITPKMPSRMTIAAATAAGMSHGGRSDGRPPRDGGRTSPARLSKVAFLTGGTGFIGGNLARALLKDGWHVRALARPESDRRNLEGLELDVVERSIDRTEVYQADEAFLCGTGVQVAPIVEVDRRAVGTGRPGTITMGLQEAYFRAVRGQDPRYRQWCTPVYGGMPRIT